jgi:hypothetical protein
VDVEMIRHRYIEITGEKFVFYSAHPLAWAFAARS